MKFEIEIKKIIKGQIIIFTRGRYSDFEISGNFIALKDFDIQDAVINFATLNELEFDHHASIDTDCSESFFEFLELSGLIEKHKNARTISTGKFDNLFMQEQ